MKTKDQILNRSHIQITRLQKEKPLLAHNICKSMDEYKNQATSKLLTQRDVLLHTLIQIRADLFYQLESKFGTAHAITYPSIMKADDVIKKIRKEAIL